jgi:hypothetical protein
MIKLTQEREIALAGGERRGLGSVTATPACSHARISSPLK